MNDTVLESVLRHEMAELMAGYASEPNWDAVLQAARADAKLTPDRPTTRRRGWERRRIAVGAGLVAAVAVVVAVVAVVALNPWGGSSADAAALHRAAAAVTAPTHTIQHIRQVLHQGTLTVQTESWESIDDPGSARRIETSTQCGTWAKDISNSLTEKQWFDSAHNRIVRTRLEPARVRASWPPLGGPRTEFDPTVPFTIALQNGSATVVGETIYAGTPVTHISWPEDPASDPDGTARNSLYVDTATGAPIVYFWGGGRLDATGGLVAQQRFLTYEFLPETAPSTADLSETGAHPDATVDPYVSGKEFDREFQIAQRLHCPGGVG